MRPFTDFHSHILPQMDDGSRSVEESLAMLRLEHQQGIRHVVATPHFYAQHDSPDHFLRRRSVAWDALQAGMKAHAEELPSVILGAEVYYFPGISDSEMLEELTIEGTRYLLLELPMAPWSKSMYKEIEGIYLKQGITPIIAHVDRYIRPLKTYRIPAQLAELPVLVQANASFFLHSTTAHMALRMLKKEQIHLLGSDCHNLSSRAPNLLPAVQRIERNLGETALERLCFCEQSILSESRSSLLIPASP